MTAPVTGSATVNGQRLTASVLWAPPSSVTVRPAGVGIVAFESLPFKGSIEATLAQVPGVSQVSFLPGTFSAHDFDAAGFGTLVPLQASGGLRGSGIGKTVFTMDRMSSTAASKMPIQVSGNTNELYIMRIGAGGGTVRSPILSDFSIVGTEQGHMYGGLRLYMSSKAQLSDLFIGAIPGNASSQPGETDALGGYRDDLTVAKRIETDGRNLAGQRIGGSGICLNYSTNAYYEDCSGHHSGAAHGWALFKAINTTLVRPNGSDNAGNGINVEDQSGFLTLDHPTMLRNGGRHLTLNSSQGYTAKVDIIEPTFDGPLLRILHGGAYAGFAQSQLTASVTLIKDGVPRPDLIRWES